MSGGDRRLQTSPYLTRVMPGEASSVSYWSDTHGPAAPTGEPAGPGVVFGIVGLDRRIVWQSEQLMLDLLRASAAGPVEASALAERFGADLVAAAVARDWLQKPDEVCRGYHLISGEIEVTAHCNWGCRFCPVATDPKPRRTMPLDLFEEVAAKLAVVPTLRYVTFQFFNEPLLDRLFPDRLDVLARYGLQLALYTNASAFTPERIEALRRPGALRHLIVNLPSIDEAEFARLTGSRSFLRTTANLDAAIEAGLPVQIVVNGVGASLARNLAGVRARYEPAGVEVFASATCDRAGAVGGDYFQNIDIRGRLTGCGWPIHHANISVAGDLFLCCNDYFQRERFGNITAGSLHELMTSDAAVALRRQVFGVDDAPAGLPCRRCHNQRLDYGAREFRPLATFG